jgi:thymidine kinase
MNGIELIMGPMFCSKTSEIFRRLFCDISIGRKVLYINHGNDNRSETKESFSTHNPLYKDAVVSKMENIIMWSLNELPSCEKIRDFHTIAIDEAQFFSNLEIIVDYAEKENKRVIVAGLVGDFKREKFGKIIDLIPKANSVELLYANCIKCAQTSDIPLVVPAYFTHRIIDNNSQIDVGGSDKYIPVCRKHFIELNQ